MKMREYFPVLAGLAFKVLQPKKDFRLCVSEKGTSRAEGFIFMYYQLQFEGIAQFILHNPMFYKTKSKAIVLGSINQAQDSFSKHSQGVLIFCRVMPRIIFTFFSNNNFG